MCWPWPASRQRSSWTPTRLVRVRAARDVVDRVLASGESVYGLNTGLGSLARHHIPLEEIGAFSFATVADQVSSYGRPLPTDVVRAMMVSRVNGMLKAGVGVRRELIELLVALLNARVHPVVRMVGSVGQGDLSEMADIGKVLIGRGWAEYDGRDDARARRRWRRAADRADRAGAEGGAWG